MNILLKGGESTGRSSLYRSDLIIFYRTYFCSEGTSRKIRGSGGVAPVVAPRAVGGKAGIVGGGEKCIRAV